MLEKNVLLTAMNLSSIIYEGEDHLIYSGLEKVKFLNDKSTDTQGAIMVDKFNKIVYVVFRGTAGDKDIVTDIRCLPKEVHIDGKECHIHRGFYKAYESVKDDIKLDEYKDYKVVACGHSLGGALATIFITSITHKDVAIVTFGSPRVGDSRFVSIFKSKINETYRFVHENDVVPMVPKIYDHVTGRIRLDDNGDVISYMNIWKRISYWLKGFKHFEFNVFSVKDHFMKSYINVVTKWLAHIND